MKAKGEKGDRMRWLDNIIDSMGMNLSKLFDIVEDRGACCAAVHGVTKSQTGLVIDNNKSNSNNTFYAKSFFYAQRFAKNSLVTFIFQY